MKKSNKHIESFFNNLAPTWDNSQDREDFKFALIDQLGLKEGDRVLDLACGTGVVTSKIQSITKTKVTALDISKKMIDIAKSKCQNPEIDFRVGDFYEFDETNFDYIVILTAYPHFLDLDELKKKFHETLKHGGRVAIIHACGREELNSHHATHALKVSRMLNSVDEEAKFYSDCFKIIRKEEDNNHFLLILEKK